MAETTSTTVTEVIEREAYAASVLYFSAVPGLDGFVTKKDLSGLPTLSARFPIYDIVSATAIAEATDFTTSSTIDTSNTVTVAVTEHAILFVITDLASGGSRDTLMTEAASQGSIAGRMASEALQRRLDGDIAALFSGFNSSTGSNSGAITSTLLITAIGQLDIDNIPREPRVAVLHPYQWRTLIPTFDDAASYGVQGQQVVTTGLVGRIYGADIFVTSNVATATVSGSTTYAGCVMHPSAVALAVKGPLPTLEVQRDASLRAFEVVGTGVWGEAEYRGGATTSGVGGAGVFLYSNTTV